MAERPDLDYAIPILREELLGSVIAEVELHKPAVLRLAVEGSLEQALVGATIVGVSRHLHFVCFELAHDLELIISPMLAGTLSVHEPNQGSKRDRAFTMVLGDGRHLRYRDRVQMGKVYVLPKQRHDLVPGFAPVGIDVLDTKTFHLDRFFALARTRNDQVKVFLLGAQRANTKRRIGGANRKRRVRLDKSALDSFGNAYADEVLFAAGIHPKTFVRKLTDEDLKRLHKAMGEVLSHANEQLRLRKPATDGKLRDFLKVRGRHKQPCPSCQTPIRKAGVRGYDAYFCPTCQPQTRKTGIVDWR